MAESLCASAESQRLRALAMQMFDSDNGVVIADRTWRFRKFSRCFVGSEAVSWLLSTQQCNTESEAIAIGEAMRRKGWIRHVCGKHTFKNENLFYQFFPPTEADVLGEKVPLVFVHGFKGSHLENETTKQRVYLTKKEAAGLATPNLALPQKWTAQGTQERDEFVPGTPISSVFGVDVYGKLLSALQALPRPFYTFSYDWRRSNFESATKLEEMLESIHKQHKGTPIQVIAHSNGGLVTWNVLNKLPHLFHSVLFAGVPFVGGPGLLFDLHVGTATGLNKQLLSPSVLQTYPVAYTFFHTDPTKTRLFDSNMNPIECDLYDADEWEKHKLGPYAGNRTVELVERVNLENCLRSAKQFRETIVYDESVDYPPVTAIVGIGRPTLDDVMKGGPKAYKGWDFDTPTPSDGDGRVLAVRAVPPLPKEKFTQLSSPLEHSSLLSDVVTVQSSLDALLLAVCSCDSSTGDSGE